MVWGVQHIFKMGGLALEGLTQVLKGWDGIMGGFRLQGLIPMWKYIYWKMTMVEYICLGQ